MKLISLTQGKFVQVDDEDYEHLNKFKWHAHKSGNTFYAERGIWNGKNMTNVKMHRLLLNITDKNIIGDHVDRNGINNQKHNLRTATKSHNGANRKSWGSSKYLGVSFDKKYNHFKASIQKDKKIKHIGCFKSEEEAALAYNIFAKNIHGEFANLNTL